MLRSIYPMSKTLGNTGVVPHMLFIDTLQAYQHSMNDSQKADSNNNLMKVLCQEKNGSRRKIHFNFMGYSEARPSCIARPVYHDSLP